MAYVKQTWKDEDSNYPADAARMGHIEEGIEKEEERALAAEALKVAKTEKGKAEGVATLDSKTKLTESLLPESVVIDSEAPPVPQQYKHSGDTDDTASFERLFEAGKNGAYVPPGVYEVSNGLALPVNMSLRVDPGATIKAVAAIAGPLLTVGNKTEKWRDHALEGGKFDCNGAATNGVSAPYFLNATFRDFVVLNPAGHGLILGDPEATGESNEHKVQGVKVDRDSSGEHATVPEGSYGIWERNSADGFLHLCTAVGAQTSFRNDKSDNSHVGCHGWGWAGHLPETIFDDNGADNEYLACNADTPSEYGYLMRNFNWRIIGGIVYNNTSGSDNVVVGVHTVNATPFASIIGVDFKGADSEHRIAKDYDGTLPNSGLKSYGCFNTNVALGFLTTERTTIMQASSWFQPTGGGHIYSAIGAPTISGTAGDFYLRTDTPTTANQRLYVCTENGVHWTGIL